MKFIKTEFDKLIEVSKISSLRVFEKTKGDWRLEARMTNGYMHTIFSSNDDVEVWNKYQDLISKLNIEVISVI